MLNFQNSLEFGLRLNKREICSRRGPINLICSDVALNSIYKAPIYIFLGGLIILSQQIHLLNTRGGLITKMEIYDNENNCLK